MGMLKTIVVLLIAAIQIGCAVDAVTGRGNGGNGLAMSEEEVTEMVDVLKPQLKQLFMGLKHMHEAEKIKSGITDLSEFPELVKLLDLMFGHEKIDIFADIDTKNNIDPIDEMCVDDFGHENVGAAHAGKPGTTVCLSIPGIRKMSPKGAKAIANIQLLAVAAHEFGHHYLNSKKHEEDEVLLRVLQAFINYQLQKYNENNEYTGLVSTSETQYLDIFELNMKEKLETAKNNKVDEEAVK